MALPEPHLTVMTGRHPSSAVVLVLHGGRELSSDPVRARQLAVLRMRPIARRIARGGHGRVAVARLRYAIRGWNGPDDPAPVRDAEWALRRLTERFPDLPIGLVGHSMGGRTALRVAGHRQVRGVVGLAPWLPAGEPVSQLADRRVLLMHGALDRVTSPAATAGYATRAEAAGASVSLVSVSGEGHAMLRRAQLWHALTARFVLGSVLPDLAATALPRLPSALDQVVTDTVRITC
ncbi:dienelactone hydrolase family protein [Jatrophihabitans sp.]|uniref:dienelactone hydrolase family protein n=1 Tax=Jatrophihabitans sp. TaxID=1932789 RepID=UPI002C22201C|nr:alpha/beta fold hydrolase [Jatrophihabitans sp.]